LGRGAANRCSELTKSRDRTAKAQRRPFQDAPSRQRKLHLLKLAVSNSVRAQILEKERLKRTRTPAVRKRVFELTKAVAKGAAE
jgi:hypothetical protein